ncbi:MAG: heparinase II/III family protein [Verrucomicrobia bacterium]|nr:heparinase II/III family protein [Verrucomicrobiota bacterium]
MNPSRALFAAVVCSLATALVAVAADVAIPMPPAEHPRLYLRAAEVAKLPQRLAHPVLAPTVARLEKLAKRSPQARVEWEALQWLVKPDAAKARATIAETLALLQACQLADRQDACRETGRMMVTGAIVYDWLYPLLTAEQKQAFGVEFVRLAKTQECGYPVMRGGSVTGHTSEAMIMRDILSAGIATYDEDPEMYRLAATRFFREHLPARNWFYPGNAYHQGDSYGVHRYSLDLFPLFIFDRLGAGNVYNPQQQFVPYYWIYTTRPDGQRMRAGDSFKVSTAWGTPWNEFGASLLTASYYGDGVLLSQAKQQGGAGDGEAIFELLWRDPDLAPKPIAALPLSRYFGSPFGWMVARTGWGEDAVVAERKINDYNCANHQHLDAAEFQLYARGALAIDSGLYEGGSSGNYGSPHHKNYYWRTIAHNALLVYDPAEKFNAKGDYGNDGGQRLPNGRSEPRTLEDLRAPEKGYRTGRVLAHGFGPDAVTPDYTLLQGDLTAAYSAKVRGVTRSFVFLNLRNTRVPAALIVFDRVVSADPVFRKFWLLHTVEEPRLDGVRAAVERTEHGARGQLNLDVLWPAADNVDLGKVGGPGKEYWVFGTNYTNDLPAARRAAGSMETGAWRIELSPKRAAAEDLFFTVMQTTDRMAPARLPVKRIESGHRVGCVLGNDQATWVVLLRKDSQRSAEKVAVTVPGTASARVLLTDLAAGRWEARRAGAGKAVAFEVTAESGAGWFEGDAGEWMVELSAAR